MPQRAKPFDVWTIAPPESEAARVELMTDIQCFLVWANRARTGETSLQQAIEADAVLTAIYEGKAVRVAEGSPHRPTRALGHIIAHIGNGHWHLAPCRYCNQWLLAFHQRRVLCRRDECLKQAAAERSERVLDRHDNELGRQRQRRRRRRTR